MRTNAFRIIGPFTCLLLFTAPAASAQEGRRLQGQVRLEDQLSGRSLRPFKKHVRVVGHNDILNRGLNGNLGWVVLGISATNRECPRAPRTIWMSPRMVREPISTSS